MRLKRSNKGTNNEHTKANIEAIRERTLRE